MKFRCEKCKTRYTIADQKVHRKVLKIRCKNCDHTIIVRDPQMAQQKGEVTALQGPALASGPLEEPREVEWYYAREGESIGPMPFERLRDLIRDGALEPDDVLWNERMGDWTCLSDLPDLLKFMPRSEPEEADTRAFPGVADRPSLRDERTGQERPLRKPAPEESDETILEPILPLDSDLLQARMSPTPKPRRAPDSDPPLDLSFRTPEPQDPLFGLGAPKEGPLLLEPQDSELPLVFPDEVPEESLDMPGFESLNVATPAPTPGPAPIAPRGEPRVKRDPFPRQESVILPGFDPLGPAQSDHHDELSVDLPPIKPASNFGKHFVMGFLGLLLLGGGIVLGIKLSPSAPPPKPDAQVIAAVVDAAVVDAEVVDAGVDAAVDAEVGKKKKPRRKRRSAKNGKNGKNGKDGSGKSGKSDEPKAEPTRSSRFNSLSRSGPRVNISQLDRKKAKSDLPDGLNQQQIMKVIRSSQRGIRACYERQLKRDDSIRSSKAKLRFKIMPSGRTSQVKIGKQFNGTVLETCLTGLVGRWRFPEFNGEPQAVEYPIIFQAAP